MNDRTKKIIKIVSLSASASVLVTGIIGGIHHAAESDVRNSQFNAAFNMRNTILQLTSTVSPENYKELQTQIANLANNQNKDYDKLCDYVERKQEVLDVVDYLSEQQLFDLKTGNFSEEKFEALNHKQKEAAILYLTELLIQDVEMYQGLDENGFSIANEQDMHNYYTNTEYGVDGFNRLGIDREGYDRAGFAADGFNREGIHKDTNTHYNPEGYDREGYDEKGFNKDGIHKETGNEYDPEGYNREGYNKEGYNREGYDREGYDKYGYDKDGYNRSGFNKDGIHKETGTEYGPDGFNIDGIDKYGYDKEGSYVKGEEESNNTNDNVSSGADVDAGENTPDYGMGI